MIGIQALKTIFVNTRRGFSSKSRNLDAELKQLQTQFPKLKLSQDGSRIQCQVKDKKQTLTYGEGQVDVCLAHMCNGNVYFNDIESTLLSKGYVSKYAIVLPDLRVVLADSQTAAFNFLKSRVDEARCFCEQIGGHRAHHPEIGTYH